MSNFDLLDKFQQIIIENPTDRIIRQIRELISSGELKPGDRLPSERKLAEKLGVGRTNLRSAIQKLEFYGILKTIPQSGTVVAGIGTIALEGLISDVLKIENADFGSLVETRVLLETEAAKLAASRRTEANIVEIKKALLAFETKVEQGLRAVEEDFIFHLKIAEASQNAVLKSLMLIITPDIIHQFNKLDICKDGRDMQGLQEHHLILENIIEQNSEAAADAMRIHLKDVYDYSQDLKRQQ
ncbi:GntR family transcriptional regulator [marine bacterium AO1-C]|nr:GntR family transcriptional regulator [marine bacterium AO1-C]